MLYVLLGPNRNRRFVIGTPEEHRPGSTHYDLVMSEPPILSQVGLGVVHCIKKMAHGRFI